MLLTVKFWSYDRRIARSSTQQVKHHSFSWQIIVVKIVMKLMIRFPVIYLFFFIIIITMMLSVGFLHSKDWK